MTQIIKRHKKPAISYLSQDEIYSIEKLLNRQPNDFELHMFAEMWSEHISYKSSVKWLEELPVKGSGIHISAGEENAGVFDLTEELACVVKMESHNHPTAINPDEASVAVGNVIRDIIAMGAQPVAQLNIFRFGDINRSEIRSHLNKVVRALGSYSNSFGIPVVGGELLFNRSYNDNPLLNIMGIGLVKKDKIVTSSFKKTGDILILLGKGTTGTGVHGAGFASTALTDEQTDKVPEDQLADPYIGKILLDCLLEINDKGILKSMQDIGAGGVLCAASEMAFRGKKGVDVFLEKISENKELDPVDLMLSQSQEQMLLSIEKSFLKEFEEITKKWTLDFRVIGKVTDNGRIRLSYRGELQGDIHVSNLVRGGGAPVYLRNMKASRRKAPRVSAEDVPLPGNLKELAKSIIRHPNVASRKYIYEQFDTMAGLSNLGSFVSSDAGVISVPGSKKLLALSVDGNSRYIRCEPKAGTMIAVVEAARNIVCSGGIPFALTNGLNFGDPSDLGVYSDFAESIKGIKAVSEKMNIPVIAGNVSFNNVKNRKGKLDSVQPTPVIGMVGVIESSVELTSVSFRSKGDMIFLLGSSDNDVSGSQYLSLSHLIENTAAPLLDLDHELKLQEIVKGLIGKGLIESAHDVSLGGLFVTLVQCCLKNNLGFDITSPAEVRVDAFLFGESQSRIVVSVPQARETDFIDYMIETGFPFSALGHVTRQELRIDDTSFGFITDYARDFENALGDLLSKE